MAANSEKRQLQDQNQEQQQPMVAPAVVQQTVAAPQQHMFVQPQPMIVQIRKPPLRRYDKYEGVRSRALGITQIVCAILAIIINAAGLGMHDRAQKTVRRWSNEEYSSSPDGWGRYYWDATTGYYSSCGFWCTPMFIICGSFAIFAAKRPTKCPVITCLVLAILSSVFGATALGMATWTVAEDAKRLDEGFMFERHTNTYYRNREYNQNVTDPGPVQVFNPIAAAWAKKVIVVSVLFLCVSIAQLVSSIWIAIIAGKVLSTVDPQNAGGAQIQYIPNTQAPGQIIILDRHGRPIPDAQVIQVPGNSNMQSGGNMAPLPQGQVVAPATQPVQVAPYTQESSGPVVTPSGQPVNVQPPSYTPADSSQQHSKTEDSPPPPYQ